MKNKHSQLLVLDALRFFVENPLEEVYLRDFARRMEISPNSAQRFLDSFVEKKFVIDERKGNMRYFRSNLDSITFRQIKIVFSLECIENSGFIEACREMDVTHCVLFGSIAKGLDDKESDIDFVLIGNKIKPNFREFEKKLGREIQVKFFSWDEWKKQAQTNKAFYQDVITQGIAIIGGMPLV
ncbi:MAG: nucleotidyltransferase domain-containing protein [archaeon]